MYMKGKISTFPPNFSCYSNTNSKKTEKSAKLNKIFKSVPLMLLQTYEAFILPKLPSYLSFLPFFFLQMLWKCLFELIKFSANNTL